MKKIEKITLLSVLFLLAIMGCKKVPDGFISEYIRYEELPHIVPQGRAYVSQALNPDGSGNPLDVTLLAVYNAETGEDVTELFNTQYTIPVWTSYYDPKIDTTLEMIDAKRKDSLVYPVSINRRSGQLEANYATVNLPQGTYDFDLQIKNPAGTRVYPKIGQFVIEGEPAYENPDPRTTVAMKVGEETTTKALPGGRIEVEYSEGENKIIVQIVDQHGTAFNPKAGEIGRRPQPGTGGGWLQTMQDYALSYEAFDDRMEFVYGVNPFPLSSLGNGFNYYYRIPTQYVRFDESLELPDNEYSCNARFSFRAFQPGTYRIKVIVDGATKK